MKNTFETIEIAPSVRLCGYETDRFTTSSITVSIAVPLDPNAASANAILPYLLTRSSEKYKTYMELNKKLASLYGAALVGANGKHGDTYVIRMTVAFIDNKFAFDGEDISLDAARLLFDMLFKPNLKDGVFDSEELEKEKRLAAERIEAKLNDKRTYARERCEEIMCEGDVYSTNVDGTVEGILALTPSSVYTAYLNLIRGGRIQINAVGNINGQEIANLFETYLSAVAREPYMLFTSVLYSAENVKRVTEELPVKQGKLVLGFRAGMVDPDADFAKIRIMTDIFGGGTYSRLFMNVREKMSLCYYCSARLYSTKGIILVQSGIEDEKAEIAITEIQNQLKDLANGNVSDEDLSSSLRSLTDAYKKVIDAPDTIDAWLFAHENDDEIVTPDMLTEKIKNVTKEEIIEAAKAVTLDTIYLLKNSEKEAE